MTHVAWYVVIDVVIIIVIICYFTKFMYENIHLLTCTLTICQTVTVIQFCFYFAALVFTIYVFPCIGILFTCILINTYRQYIVHINIICSITMAILFWKARTSTRVYKKEINVNFILCLFFARKMSIRVTRCSVISGGIG